MILEPYLNFFLYSENSWNLSNLVCVFAGSNCSPHIFRLLALKIPVQLKKMFVQDMMLKLWQCTNEITKAEWPKAYQAKSPCPTLKVGVGWSDFGLVS